MAVWFFSMHCQTLVNIYCWKKRLCTARSDKQMRESGKLSPHRVRNSFRWGGRAEEGTIDSENCHLRLILCPPPSPSVLFFFFLSPSPLREEFLSPHRRPDPQLPPPPPSRLLLPVLHSAPPRCLSGDMGQELGEGGGGERGVRVKGVGVKRENERGVASMS